MRPYTDAQLLELWENGLVQHPVDRALTFLLAVEPQQTRTGLAELPLGQRDARLMEMYTASFGPRLEGAAACPACGAQLEFSVDAGQFSAPEASSISQPHSFSSGEYQVRFRPANSFDLAAAAAGPDDAAARQTLLARCVLEVQRGGLPLSAAELPEAVAAEVEDRLAESDPLAELLLNLTCPACGHAWQESLDVPGFLWAQVSARARRLLIEVHTLASAYGWSEAEIVALGPQRRQAYLELIG